MKLNKDEIKFIDTYLSSNEVIYADIRQEMLDHIASAVEEKIDTDHQDFYHAFKEYMLANKTAILKNNKTRWSYSWDAVKQFLLFLVKPYMLVFAAILFLFFSKVDVNTYFSDDFTINMLFFAMVITTILFQTSYIQLYLKKKFYAVEKIFTILKLIYFAQMFFFPFFGKEIAPPHILTIFFFLFFGYVTFFIRQLIKFNKHRFNYI